MHIVAAGSYCAEASDDLRPLKSLAREATGTSARRTGRFIQLALIGAGRCVGSRTLAPDTATYFTSGRGDLEITVDLLRQLYERGLTPAPFDFINTVGSSAGFHVARSFGLRGRSLFVTRRYAPLESALRLAAIDMADGAVRTALVGSADVCTSPLSAHRARIGLPAGTPVGEGSHWFLLTAEPSAETGLGDVRTVRSFAEDGELVRHLDSMAVDPETSVLAGGQSLGPDRLAMLAGSSGIRAIFTYDEGIPWYDSRTGHGLHAFLTAPPARTLVHVDGDPSGRVTLLVVDATSPGGPGSRRPPREPRTDR